MKTLPSLCLLVLCVTFTKLFAQYPEHAFGKRAAKIPRTEADTGLHYNEGRMFMEAMKYWMEPRLSGAVKDIHAVDRIATESFRTLRHPVAMKQQAMPAWQPIAGSQNGHDAGRSRDIAFVGQSKVFVATAGGGLWKTDDIAANSYHPTWIPLTDRLPTNSLGSVVVDPTDERVIYLGTGEVHPDGYDPSDLPGLGEGIFKSIDGGNNWFRILGTDTAGRRCAKIILNPQNPQTVYVATGTSKTAAGTSGGVLRSHDRGKTWTVSTLTGAAPLYMAIDPMDTNRLYVATASISGDNPVQGKIFRTTNAGNEWTQLGGGLPTSGVGRIAIAVAAENPNVVYASIGRSAGDSVLGRYVSNNYGDTWTKVGDNKQPYLGMQAFFANCVTVNPELSRHVLFAGLDIWSSAALVELADGQVHLIAR